MKKTILTLLFIALSSCSSQSPHPHTVRVGTIAGPETELMQVAANVAKKRYGLTVDITTFSNYIIPNQALNDGDIDANAFQHLPYLKAQNKARGFNLVSVGKTLLYPMGLYSHKITQLSQLTPGAKVAIPNDPSNEARALLLLQQVKLITLKPHSGSLVAVTDIKDNPKQLDIMTLSASQLPRTLDDVSLAAINTTYAIPAKLNPAKALAREDNRSQYVNIIATTAALAHSQKIQELVKAYQSKPVAKAAQRLFGHNALLGWKPDVKAHA